MSNDPPIPSPRLAQPSIPMSGSTDTVGTILCKNIDTPLSGPSNMSPNDLIPSSCEDGLEAVAVRAVVSGSNSDPEGDHESGKISTGESQSMSMELEEVESESGRPCGSMSGGSESPSSIHRDIRRVENALEMSGSTTSDMKSVLEDIRELLREEREERRQCSVDEKLEKLQQTNNELSSTIAVMAVFIAALNAALLSYTNDVYSNRVSSSDNETSPAPGEKYSDKVTISCLVTSMFLALAPASFAGLSKHRMTVRVLSGLKYWLKDIMNKPFLLGGQGRKNRTTNETGNVEVIVNDMLVWTVSFLGPSMLLLTTGVFVFCWAEQPRAVAQAAAAAVGYSTLRMIVFFANSVRLSSVTVEYKRSDDTEGYRPQTRGVRHAQRPSEDMGDTTNRWQLVNGTVTTPSQMQGPYAFLC